MKRIVSIAIAALALVACAKNQAYRDLAWGYRIVNASARLGEQFDKALAEALKITRDTCLAKQPKAPDEIDRKAFGNCVAKALKISRAWTGEKDGAKGPGALPALQASQRGARRALDIAFDYLRSTDGKCSADCKTKTEAWKQALKNGLCEALEVVTAGLKLGASKLTESATFKLVVGFAGSFLCGGEK